MSRPVLKSQDVAREEKEPIAASQKARAWRRVQSLLSREGKEPAASSQKRTEVQSTPVAVGKPVLTFQQVVDEENERIVKSRGGKAIQQDLVGLSFSGGGIRSATFCLGVMERLREIGLLKKVDYLSSVSGGGYAGGWLSANVQRSFENQKKEWLEPDVYPQTLWEGSIRHLRRYSNYLAPKVGLMSADTWSVAAIWIRNTLMIQLTIAMLLACILVLPWLILDGFQRFPESHDWRWLTILLFVFGASGVTRNQVRISHKDSRFARLLEEGRWQTAVGMVLVPVSWLYMRLLSFDPFVKGEVPRWPAVGLGLLCIVAGFLLEPVEWRLLERLWRLLGTKTRSRLLNYSQGLVQGFVVVPLLLASVLVAAVMWGQATGLYLIGELRNLNGYSQFFLKTLCYWPFPLTVTFVALLGFSLASLRKGSGVQGWVWSIVAAMFSITTFHALLAGIMMILHGWALEGSTGELKAFVWVPAMVMYSFSLAIVVMMGIMGRNCLEGGREWWSRLGAWLAIYGLGWMVVVVAAVYSPWGIFWLGQRHWSLAAGGWVGTTLAGLFAGKGESTGKEKGKPSFTDLAMEAIAVVAPYVFVLGLLALVAVGVDKVIGLNSPACDVGSAALSWTSLLCADPKTVWIVLGLCFALLVVLSLRVDINEFSLNAFYRSRLVRCYLGATRRPESRKPEKFTGFDDDDDLHLTELKKGPIHLVNCALNLGGSSDLSLHTRHSANFTLSPLHCGTHYEIRNETGSPTPIGYMRTADYGDDMAKPTLGQAISISGAAASPNMGYHTSPVVAFLMTVFNVRLGWWFARPKAGGEMKASPGFALPYLTKELFGGANESSTFLSVSDGGHFENLAAYELVKRHCRVIVLCDAECDPKLQFEGLGSLIRMCAIDGMADIEIDLSGLGRDELGWSRTRCAVGAIHYPDKTLKPGILIYLKASMTGHEPSDVLQYHAVNPSFPHESTSDQFYSEMQFESYRSLGYDIAKRTFDSVAPAGNVGCPVAVAKDLLRVWAPPVRQTNRFIRNSSRLMDLWDRIGKDENLAALDAELTPQWPAAKPADNFRTEFYVCCEMLQLMENVYLDLNLEETWGALDNSGWRNMFLDWAKSATLRDTWKRTNDSYGLRFQSFCKLRLELP